MKTKPNTISCCFCGEKIRKEDSKKAYPVIADPRARCCDYCQKTIVIPACMARLSVRWKPA